MTRLQAFTLAHPPSPRKTVQSYLLTLQGPFEDPGLEPLSSSPAYTRDRTPRSPPNNRLETALTLHPYHHHHEHDKNHRKGKEGLERDGQKPKKSLVAALQPRLSNQLGAGVQPQQASASSSLKPAPKPTKVKENERRNKASRFVRDDSSSAELIARIDQASDRQNEPEPGPSRQRQEEPTMEEPVKVAEPSRRARKENEPAKPKHKSKASPETAKARDSKQDGLSKGKGKAKAEPTVEELEEQEAEEQRRRAKALIVKDRSKSATAVGTAAAAKVVAAANTSSSRKSKRITPSTSDESILPKAAPKPHKKTKADHAHGFVIEIPRAKNLGASRLTLQPPRKLGVFKKGAASGKVNVKNALPDLPFSEHAFLDVPQPSDSKLGPSASPSDMSSIEPLPAPTEKPPIFATNKKPREKQQPRQPAPDSDRTSSLSGLVAIVAPRKAALPKGARRLDLEPAPLRNPLGPSPRLSNSRISSSNASMLSPAASAIADTTSLHSAYSLRLRRERATKTAAAPTPSNLGSAPVIDTSAFWSKAANAAITTTTKSPPVNDSASTMPTSKEGQVSSLPQDSSSGFIQPDSQIDNALTPSSSSIERLLQDCAMPLQEASSESVPLQFDQPLTIDEDLGGSARWRSPALAAHSGQLVGSVIEQQLRDSEELMYASKRIKQRDALAPTHDCLVQTAFVTAPSSSLSSPPSLLDNPPLSDESFDSVEPVFIEPTSFSPRQTRSHQRVVQSERQDDSTEFHEAMRRFWPRSKC
ncbi:BQ2448_4625 [Microbotryum intermedium]|uniref:BQ2448_4625 protein n=1 Tax=Microbotryum intermedium TaxID=269621 RepID=A0A238FIF7_9BASI|nr:BQ2448_4625 [Microbotryum intermedium]